MVLEEDGLTIEALRSEHPARSSKWAMGSDSAIRAGVILFSSDTACFPAHGRFRPPMPIFLVHEAMHPVGVDRLGREPGNGGG